MIFRFKYIIDAVFGLIDQVTHMERSQVHAVSQWEDEFIILSIINIHNNNTTIYIYLILLYKYIMDDNGWNNDGTSGQRFIMVKGNWK